MEDLWISYQVVEAVKRQHTDSVHPRSIFHIFLDPRLSVAPLAHFFFLFDVFDGLCWFLMVFHVFNMFFIFSIFFPSAFPELSLYKMENMGRTLGGSHYKMENMGQGQWTPLQNPKLGFTWTNPTQSRCFMAEDGFGDWHTVPIVDGMGSLQAGSALVLGSTIYGSCFPFCRGPL